MSAWARFWLWVRCGSGVTVRRPLVYPIVARAIFWAALKRAHVELRWHCWLLPRVQLFLIWHRGPAALLPTWQWDEALRRQLWLSMHPVLRVRARRIVRGTAARYGLSALSAALIFASIAAPGGMGGSTGQQRAYDLTSRTWFGALASTVGRPFYDVQAFINPADPDQTNAVNAGAGAANGNGILYFAGSFTYNVGGGSIFVNSNTIWMGAGPSAVLHRTANWSIITFAASRVGFATLAFDGGGQTFNIMSIQSASTRCWVDTCWFSNTGNGGDGVSFNAASLCRMSYCDGVTLQSPLCDFNNATTQSLAEGLTIVGCGTATAPQIWVRNSGTNFNEVSGHCSCTAGVGGPIQSDTNAAQTQILASYFSGGAVSSSILNNSSQSLTQGNICTNAAIDGIDCGNANQFQVIGNWCLNNAAHGIEVNAFTVASVRGVVEGNHCINNSQGSSGTYSGVVVQSASGLASSHHIVKGNNCFDTQGGGATQAYGVAELNGGVGVTDLNNFEGNDCTTNKLGAMNLSGPSSRAWNNPGFNPQGVAGVGNVASPWTYTNADHVDETITLDGARGAAGTLTVAKNGTTLYTIGNNEKFHLAVADLQPAEQLVITYTTGAGDTLVVNKDRK